MSRPLSHHDITIDRLTPFRFQTGNQRRKSACSLCIARLQMGGLEQSLSVFSRRGSRRWLVFDQFPNRCLALVSAFRRAAGKYRRVVEYPARIGIDAGLPDQRRRFSSAGARRTNNYQRGWPVADLRLWISVGGDGYLCLGLWRPAGLPATVATILPGLIDKRKRAT